MMQRSGMCLELRLKEAEGWSGWRSLSATSRSWNKVRVDDNGGGEQGEIGDVPRGGDMGIRLLILSGEVFDSGNLFASGPNLSGARAFDVYLWSGRTPSVEIELSSGGEGLVGGSEPAVEDD